jgi:hypothetical protein
MKTLVFLLFCFAPVTTGCSNNVQETELPLLYGKWIWIQSSGGIDGRTITPNENEPAKFLQFVKPDIIESYIGNRLISSRSFELKKDLSIYSSDSLYFIIDGGGSFPKVIFGLTEKTLSLADNVYDGFSELYNRVDE